jgi:tRNA modification GTPase
VNVFAAADTIVAIASPPGRGSIGVVRFSGPAAHTIACALVGRGSALTPRHATLANVRCGRDGREGGPAIDQVIALYFPGPASYTGEDVVELSAHGSPVVLREILAAAIASGARLAEPGEFTLRAFLNGRIDLMQAEAVADLIDSVTPLQARAAFDQLQGTLTCAIADIDARLFDLIARLEASVDFPEEGYHFVEPSAVAREIGSIIERTAALLADARRGRLVREGLQISIVGRPNVGKSSLFNALAGSARAIVTDIAGTTRDLVTETIDFDGLRVTLVDTAGLHETDDVIEAEGVRRSRTAIGVSDLVIVVADGSRPPEQADRDIVSQIIESKVLIAINKSDIGQVWTDADPGGVAISAVTGDGLDRLRLRILDLLEIDQPADRPAITNLRHITLVERAAQALERARDAALEDGGSLPEEFVLADLQEARTALEEITGKRAPDEVLSHIFSRFCIGK